MLQVTKIGASKCLIFGGVNGVQSDKESQHFGPCFVNKQNVNKNMCLAKINTYI